VGRRPFVCFGSEGAIFSYNYLTDWSIELSPFTFAGVKFIVLADNRQSKVEELLRKIYELYSDYVLKNPFYSLDMPIR